MGNTVKEYSQMIGFLTRDKTSTVPRSMDPEPRNIKLAKYIPRHEMDNMNTKDLEQTPDSVLRPGETLEDFDVTFRRPNAEGGVQQLVRNTVDGSRPGYGGNKGIKTALEEILETQTTFDSKSQLIDLIEEKVGYRPGKKIILPNKYPILKKVTYKSVLPVTSEEQLIETFGKEDLAKIRKEGVSEKLIRGRRSGKIRFANLTKVEKAKKTEDNRQKNKNLSEETALDRKEKAMVRRQSVKGYSFYKVNKAENLLWNDLLRTAKNKNGYFTFKGEAPVKEKYYNKVATENFVLVDKKGNEFKYSTLSDDITKHSGYKLDDVLRPYKQKEFLATEGLTKELNKLAGYELGSPKSVFHTQHIEGIDKNPWKVHLTFGTQNSKEAGSRKSFNADWKSANDLPLGTPEGERFKAQRAAVNRYYKSLGPDIVAQIGKKPKGEIKTLIQLLDKTGIKLTNTQRAGGTELFSFPANLKNLKNVRGKGTLIGGAIELAFYKLDVMNEMAKGKSEDEAKAQALENATLGLYKNKRYLENLKKFAEDQGIDSRAFDKVYALNDMVGKIDSQKNYYKEKIEAAKKIKTTNQEEVNKKNEVIKGLEKASASFNKSSQGMIERNIEKVAGQVSISKAGEMFPTPNLDQIADARSNITQKDFSEPFTNLRNTAFDKLKKEKTRAFDVQSRQFDTEAGSIGNLLNTRLMTLDAPGRTKEQEYINEMAKNYPQELYRYNLARGVDPDNPVTGEAYQILKAKYSGLGLAEGGLAGLMKKYYD